MIVTDKTTWAEKARYLTTQAKDDPLEYVHNEIGFNYRLTNLQAATGCAQMERLDDHIEAKRRTAAAYSQRLAAIPGIEPMSEAPWAFSIHWMYTVRVEEKSYGRDSRSLMRALRESGIQTRPLWQPLNRSPAHSADKHAPCPVAERLHREALSLPCSVGLTAHDRERVIAAVERAARG